MLQEANGALTTPLFHRPRPRRKAPSRPLTWQRLLILLTARPSELLYTKTPSLRTFEDCSPVASDTRPAKSRKHDVFKKCQFVNVGTFMASGWSGCFRWSDMPCILKGISQEPFRARHSHFRCSRENRSQTLYIISVCSGVRLLWCNILADFLFTIFL